jgi:bifunctional non-homologous end joining protein LigD
MNPCRWVKPVLIAHVKFAEWTHDDQLRQPVFLGLRTDKEAKGVVSSVARNFHMPSNSMRTQQSTSNPREKLF